MSDEPKYSHDAWCDLDKKGECDCVVALLEEKDERIETLERERDAWKENAK